MLIPPNARRNTRKLVRTTRTNCLDIVSPFRTNIWNEQEEKIGIKALKFANLLSITDLLCTQRMSSFPQDLSESMLANFNVKVNRRLDRLFQLGQSPSLPQIQRDKIIILNFHYRIWGR